jgi:hypothetical protein
VDVLHGRQQLDAPVEGPVGADRRYVMAIESLQPSDDATARATITKAVKTMVPSGRIGA